MSSGVWVYYRIKKRALESQTKIPFASPIDAPWTFCSLLIISYSAFCLKPLSHGQICIHVTGFN